MLPLIVDTDGDRVLLEQMVADACSSGMIDVAVFLMKLMVMSRPVWRVLTICRQKSHELSG